MFICRSLILCRGLCTCVCSTLLNFVVTALTWAAPTCFPTAFSKDPGVMHAQSRTRECIHAYAPVRAFSSCTCLHRSILLLTDSLTFFTLCFHFPVIPFPDSLHLPFFEPPCTLPLSTFTSGDEAGAIGHAFRMLGSGWGHVGADVGWGLHRCVCVWEQHVWDGVCVLH